MSNEIIVNKVVVVLLFILSLGLFVLTSMLYIKSTEVSERAAKRDYAFITKNDCELHNWVRQETTDKTNKGTTPTVTIFNANKKLKSKAVMVNATFTTLPHLKKFIYHCGNSITYQSRFGFFNKLSNKKSQHIESFTF